MCRLKKGELRLVRAWYDYSDLEVRLEFDKSLQTLADDLWKELVFQFKDENGVVAEEFRNIRFRLLEGNRQVAISFEFPRTFSKLNLTILQKGPEASFYSESGFFSKYSQIKVEDISHYEGSGFKFISKMGTSIKTIVWVTMSVTTVAGVVSNPCYGTILLKTVAIFNVISHLNGPILENSDLFFTILGNTSLPLPIEKFYQTSYQENGCKPPENFRKFFWLYSSCSFANLYLKSIFLFLLFSILSGILLFFTFKLKNGVAPRAKIQNQGDGKNKKKGFEAKEFLREVYGARFPIMIFASLDPMLLQYSILNLVKANLRAMMIVGEIISIFVIVLHLILQYYNVRFVFGLLDIMQLRKVKLKARNMRPVKQDKKSENLSELKLKQEGKDMKLGSNFDDDIGKEKPIEKYGYRGNEEKSLRIEDAIPGNKEGLKVFKPLPIPRKNLDRIDPILLEQFFAELNLTKSGAKKTLDDSQLEADENDEQDDQPKTKLVDYGRIKYDKALRYSALQVLIFTYKLELQQEETFLYFIPSVELLFNFLSQLVLVFQSGRGVAQVFTLTVFQTIVTAFMFFMRPCSTTIDLVCLCTYHSLLTCIYLLKLQSFWSITNTTLQNLFDPIVLALAIGMLLFALITGVFHAVRGFKILYNLNKIVEESCEWLANKKEKSNNESGVNLDVKDNESGEKEEEVEDEWANLDLEDLLAKTNLTILERIRIKTKFGLTIIPKVNVENTEGQIDKKDGKNMVFDEGLTWDYSQNKPFAEIPQGRIITGKVSENVKSKGIMENKTQPGFIPIFSRNIERIRRDMNAASRKVDQDADYEVIDLESEKERSKESKLNLKQTKANLREEDFTNSNEYISGKFGINSRNQHQSSEKRKWFEPKQDQQGDYRRRGID